jgi:hypothetical protein
VERAHIRGHEKSSVVPEHGKMMKRRLVIGIDGMVRVRKTADVGESGCWLVALRKKALIGFTS